LILCSRSCWSWSGSEGRDEVWLPEAALALAAPLVLRSVLGDGKRSPLGERFFWPFFLAVVTGRSLVLMFRVDGRLCSVRTEGWRLCVWLAGEGSPSRGPLRTRCGCAGATVSLPLR
jgi:hypothetical protein